MEERIHIREQTSPTEAAMAICAALARAGLVQGSAEFRMGQERTFDRHLEVLVDLRGLALIDFAVEGEVARPVLHELFHIFIKDRRADVAALVQCATPPGASGAREVIDGVIERYVTAVRSLGREG